MKTATFKYSSATTRILFDHRFGYLKKLVKQSSTILITDENVYKAHSPIFRNWNTIVLKPGEEYKIQATVDAVIAELISMEATRETFLVAVGGGVVCDLTGYIASIYMRGIGFGFVPTTLLSLVDASIGGKNGIDVDQYKNLVGLTRQPAFILHDLTLLQTLPRHEWSNGFAEIIKHACIRDAAMFRELRSKSITHYTGKKQYLAALVEKNATLKSKLVQKDEFEKGERKLLNFGHTIGHALETQYELSHGEAISIGMAAAAEISARIISFGAADMVNALLDQFELPVHASFNHEKVFNVLRMDKKRVKKEINFVLLEKIGKAVIKPIPLVKLEKIIREL